MVVLSDGAGKLIIDERYLEMLRSQGLDSFAAIMAFNGASLVRDKGIRRITRLTVPGPKPLTLYFKKHLRASIRDVLKEIIRGKRPISAAAQEWRAISELNSTGIETMTAVAFGEKRLLPWLRASFIITVEVDGRRLEDHVHFLRGKWREKRCIIAGLADLVRKMHFAGLNHRDLYLSHIFLIANGGEKRLSLIDLQRVQRRARGFNRWVVKDLAALNYSSPGSVVSRADRVRFLLRYLRARSLDAKQKSLVMKIARKTERIRKHDQKIK